jgi:hypothetical protein
LRNPGLVLKSRDWLAYSKKVWTEGDNPFQNRLRDWRPTDKDKELVKEAADVLEELGKAVAKLKRELGKHR